MRATILVAGIMLASVALPLVASAAHDRCGSWDFRSVEAPPKVGHIEAGVGASSNGCFAVASHVQPAGTECLAVYRVIDLYVVTYVSGSSCSSAVVVNPDLTPFIGP